MTAIREILRRRRLPQPKPEAPQADRPHNLAVVCVHWNPAGWHSLRRNYLRFRHEMRWWGVPTFAVEVAYEGQTFPTDRAFLQIRADDSHRLWQKERLINLVVDRLPEEFDRVAWIDADILFLDPHWVDRLHQALDLAPVVQLWDRWHCADDLGRVGQVLDCVGTDAARYRDGQASPGGAWAARREVLPLYDRHIVGSGDAMAVEAWCDIPMKTLARMNEPMRRHYMPWRREAYTKVGGRIATLAGDACHMYHGTRQDRRYVDRWTPVIEAGYDPARHVEVDSSGLLAWTDEAPPDLVQWVSEYFTLRNEDA